MLAAAAIKVGAERNNHGRTAIGIERRAHQRVKEQRAHLGVGAGSEDLLELIDRKHDPLARPQARKRLGNVCRAKCAFELCNRVLSRPQDQRTPTGASRQNTSPER